MLRLDAEPEPAKSAQPAEPAETISRLLRADPPPSLGKCEDIVLQLRLGNDVALGLLSDPAEALETNTRGGLSTVGGMASASARARSELISALVVAAC